MAYNFLDGYPTSGTYSLANQQIIWISIFNRKYCIAQLCVILKHDF